MDAPHPQPDRSGRSVPSGATGDPAGPGNPGAPGPIVVTVCAGTTCVVMDGSELLMLEELLPPDLQGRVRVRGVPCLEACHANRCEEAPYALVDGQGMARATPARVVEALRALIS